jgi:4-hydroxybenzoate polyprenyltransferase
MDAAANSEHLDIKDKFLAGSAAPAEPPYPKAEVGNAVKNLERTVRFRHGGVWYDLGRCWQQARPSVQLIFFLRFAVAALLGPHPRSVPSAAVAGAAAWAFAVFAVYLFNGLTDVVEDRINNPHRPLAAGILSPAFARLATGVAAVLAVVLGVAVDLWFAGLVLLFLGLGYGYSAPELGWKRTPAGTATVVLTAGSITYVAGFRAGGGNGDAVAVAVLAVAMSLWMALVGAVAKDFDDAAGDEAARRRTMVISQGARWAAVAVAAGAGAVGTGFLAASLLLAPVLVPAAAVVLAGAVVVAVSALCGPASIGNTTPYRAYMVTQHTAHVITVILILLAGSSGD